VVDACRALSEVEDGPPAHQVETAAVYVIAGIEGPAVERLDRGETPTCARLGRCSSARQEAIRG
jgi:hypothetical protein